jgi:hypothetical protein
MYNNFKLLILQYMTWIHCHSWSSGFSIVCNFSAVQRLYVIKNDIVSNRCAATPKWPMENRMGLPTMLWSCTELQKVRPCLSTESFRLCLRLPPPPSGCDQFYISNRAIQVQPVFPRLYHCHHPDASSIILHILYILHAEPGSTICGSFKVWGIFQTSNSSD